jgi:hypothetical protein
MKQSKEGLQMFTYSDDIISDLHKDARGFRPSEYFWEEWTQSPQESKQAIWDKLIEEMEYNQKEEERIEAANLAKFREQVAATMKFCDCNWKKAVEFLADAEGEDIDNDQAFDYFLWCQGIGFEDRANIRKLYKN